MLLPELLPEPELLPCDAELPDCPLPLDEPEPLALPLCAIAKAAETVKIAKTWNTRFITTLPLFLKRSLFLVLSPLTSQDPSSVVASKRVDLTGAGTVTKLKWTLLIKAIAHN